MKLTLDDRLLRRELGEASSYSKIKGIYGDRKWIKDLDIVNELVGHSGCVNALSWSKSGSLLASGSDDQHVNIHTYQGDSSTASFKFTTTIATGHTANIFSVKFMPHSNDRTIVTAAGDCQIRVFDIEHSGRSTSTQPASMPGRARGFLTHGVQFLSVDDTNTRVYSSHSDRVKKIVTESSPHLFLSCSEDGEVRQWDLRQPSSAYPRSRSSRRHWPPSTDNDDESVPPPLISYKRWNLDINSISCSPNQPHYIALGGAHLHCFLHDRRMLGRDQRFERGGSISSSNYSEHDDNAMGEATQCVRRFAPNGQRRMKRTQNGHVTACKISDANPNEMIASWSGDFIYSFDLIRSEDARETIQKPVTIDINNHDSTRRRQSVDRKRKRAKRGSATSQEGATRATSKPRVSPLPNGDGNSAVALRVRYENGQSENIPIRNANIEGVSQSTPIEATRSDAEKKSLAIGILSVKIRKHMFELGDARQSGIHDRTGHAASFTSVLGFAASTLNEMDEVIRAWRYPIEPDAVDVGVQKILRRNRESARRFVQASGTVARLLGGKLQTGSSGESPMLRSFVQVVPAPCETKIEDSSEQFSYDFLKAIILWLDSGPSALVDGFMPQGDRYRNHPRFPISEGEGIDAIEETLVPYLLRLAGTRSIPDVDSSRFEVEENRRLFDSERAAVIAFASAVKIPFEDLSRAVALSPSSVGTARRQRVIAQDRNTALKFWGFKAARGLLLNAGEGANFSFVDRAFGGLGRADSQVRREERLLNQRHEEIEPDEDEQMIRSLVLNDGLTLSTAMQDEDHVGSGGTYTAAGVEQENSDDEMIAIDDFRAVVANLADADGNLNREAEAEHEQDGEDDDEEDDDDDDDDDADEDEDDEDQDDEDDRDSDSDDEDDEIGSRRTIFRSAFERSALREQVRTKIPCGSHTRLYRGHCNVRTVKDCNFFGQNDEYVVSGSDSGHVFIWDRQTSELVNILEGDGETVNVIQGHPYEPMLAVSGIDHTVKIFSADRQARRNARKGNGVASVDPSGFSSINFGRRGRGPRPPPGRHHYARGATARAGAHAEAVDSDDTDTEPVAAATGLASKKCMDRVYEITSQNDVDRQGGNREAYLSRAMLAQLAARMRTRRAAQGGGAGASDDEEGGAGAPVVINGPNGPVVVNPDNCAVM